MLRGAFSIDAAFFATADPELPLTLAARPGDPVVVGIGDAEFELPGGTG